MTVGNLAAAVSHVGKVRSNNQDSGFAGRDLFLVADGMGGHAGGDVASAIVTQRLIEIDRPYPTAQEAIFALQSALVAANGLLAETVFEHPELAGMGTTVSAMIRVGDEIAIAHIGDSRIYLRRDGELSQISIDHTFVQRLVDAGRITEEEAMVHPRRSVLMRVLGDVDASPEIDTMILGTVPGDRWMICSDGLSGVVTNEAVLAALDAPTTPAVAANRLVRESLDKGAPDNVTVVVVDIVEQEVIADPVVVGSASAPLAFGEEPARARASRRPGLRAYPVQESHFEGQTEDYLDELIEEDRRRARRRKTFWGVVIGALVVALVVAALTGYQWTQSRYFVGVDGGGNVTIFQGVQQDIGPFALSHPYETTTIKVDDLLFYDKQQIQQTINADSLEQARTIVQELQRSDG